ncbi:GtrA family protein [Luminiphilus sp.]|nr:GtrA family protein [Luminiphilus sp.]
MSSSAFRFLIAGLLATSVNFVVALVVLLASNSVSLSVVVGYTAGIFVSYQLARLWVHGMIISGSLVNLIGFFALYSITGIMMTIIVEFVFEIIKNFTLAWLVGAVFAVVQNFYGQRIIFKLQA